jgi:glycerol transport system ATP-binding protein
MAKVTLQGLAHAYGPNPTRPEDYALRRMDHVWENGRAYALLGPSGCGKTTLLNIISGLITPTEGRVLFDERDVTHVPTEQRNIAQVFQFPVVYDTMTVAENLAFPLRNRGMSQAETRARVAAVADMLELTPHLNRRARNLGADEKQTISLGRGLVRQDVAAVLFDEPLTVIDPQLKWLLRRKLKQVHERFGLTLVYVTHDQVEALTFADEVVVMLEGQVVQVGTPQQLFERPAHTFVGWFIGSPGINLLPCTVDGEDAVVGQHRIRPGGGVAARAPKGKLELGIRPEFLEVLASPSPDALPARVRRVEDLGETRIATFDVDGRTVKARVPEGGEIPAETAWLRFPPAWTRLYADGRLVA